MQYNSPAATTDGMLDSLYLAMKHRARRCLESEWADRRLQTTALVHEAYLRMQAPELAWESKRHFLNAASLAMRRVLVDQARARLTAKRGGGRYREPLLEEIAADAPMPPERLLAIHDALDHYAKSEPVKAKFVEMLIFGGLSRGEASAAIGVSNATGSRMWAVAKLQLMKLLAD